MQITFLVGNGFDIGAGLKTSFRDFCEWYVQQRSPSFMIEQFKQDIKKDIDTWADFEAALGQYTEKFSSETGEAFMECYEDAHENMITYLQSAEKMFNIDDIAESDIARMRDGLLNFYQELTPSERATFDALIQDDRNRDTTMQFVSFNYTSCLDQYVKRIASTPLRVWEYNGNKEFKINPTTLHIHGTEDYFPVLGVANLNQVANPDLFSVPGFTECMIKPESINSIGELWYEDTRRILLESQIICIAGMSLGKTDAIWWEYIGNWLAMYEKRHLIIFWFSKEQAQPNTRSFYKRERVIRPIKENFWEHSGLTANEIKNIKDRVHIVINTQSVLQIPKHSRMATEPEVKTVLTSV